MAKINDSFEEKLKKAKEILQTLSNPDITLQDSIKAYEDGIKELNEAQKMLQDAKLKIQEIRENQ